MGNLDPDSDPSLQATTVELLRRTQAGDRAARDQLIGRYRLRLQRVAHGRVPPALRPLIDTDDIVQNTLLRALDHMDGFVWKHDGSLLGYLRKAVFNRIRDEARRLSAHQRALEQEGLLPRARPSPLENAIGAESLAIYEEALSQLTPDQRDAVVMRIEMGFSYPEIAHALGKESANASRMLVTRALARLAEALKNQRDES